MFILTTILADDIEKSIIKKIQQALESPLIIDEVEFTIYDNFPYASVKMTNLLLLESKGFKNDTLLFARRSYVEISLIDIIKKKFNLHTIIINDAKINIEYDSLNTPNFLIFKKSAKNKTPLSIKKIVLLNTNLNIKKKIPIVDMSWALKRSIILINNQSYTINTDGFSNKLVVGIIDYMNDKNFNFIASTEITKDTITLLDTNLDIEDILINIKGSILKGNILDLELEAKQQQINQIIAHLPENIQKVCSPFIANGKISFHGLLKGLVNKENNPSFKMKYTVSESDFKLKSMPFELSNIQMNGELSNGENRNFNSTKITSNLFQAKTKNGNIDGEFTLLNLNNYFLNSRFESSWDLAQVNQYFKKSPLIGLGGRLVASTNYKGNIAFNGSFKRMFLNASHKSKIKLENIQFNYNTFPLNFTFRSVDCEIDNNKILVNSCKSTISETDLNFNGEILNLIAYIFEEAPKVYLNGKTKSTYTNFTEIITLGDISNGKSKGNTIMPNWINANTTIEIKKFSYKKFTASDLNGTIIYKNKKLIGSNIHALSLNGEIDGSFTFTEPTSNHLKLISNIALKQINIRNSFEAFDNYGQEVIIKEQLKGVGSAELNIQSYWNPNFVLDKKKLKISSHLVIEKGELIDFKPLENLSSYVSLDELKHVKFLTLENTIDVANEVITIPNMEIRSSALSVFLSGTHTFNQEINYEVTLLLSELLSSSFRKKNTQITEFGEQQQDGKIFNTVYFSMTGKTDDAKISLNKIRFMQDINNSLAKEKEIIKNIIKEDLLQVEEKEKDEEGQEIEIEWNPKL